MPFGVTTRYIREECSYCKGVGDVIKKNPITGRVKAKLCPNCKGKKKVKVLRLVSKQKDAMLNSAKGTAYED